MRHIIPPDSCNRHILTTHIKYVESPTIRSRNPSTDFGPMIKLSEFISGSVTSMSNQDRDIRQSFRLALVLDKYIPLLVL